MLMQIQQVNINRHASVLVIQYFKPLLKVLFSYRLVSAASGSRLIRTYSLCQVLYIYSNGYSVALRNLSIYFFTYCFVSFSTVLRISKSWLTCFAFFCSLQKLLQKSVRTLNVEYYWEKQHFQFTVTASFLYDISYTSPFSCCFVVLFLIMPAVLLGSFIVQLSFIW